jgi:hypothetical protein
MLNRQLPASARVAILALVLGAAGCSTAHDRDRAAETSLSSRVSLAGEQSFFDDKLFVAATVGPREHRSSDRNGHDEANGPRRRRGGSGEGEARRRRAQDDSDHPAGPRMRVGVPALVLRVTLKNTSDETLVVTIRDVKSDLGNFAARPERVTLEPQQTVELDPMFSVIDSIGGDIPLTIALHSAGKNESHTLTLRSTPSSAPLPRAADATPAANVAD